MFPVLRAPWKCLIYKVKCREGGWLPTKLCPLCRKEEDCSPVKAERTRALVNLRHLYFQTFIFQGSVFHKAQGLLAQSFWSRIKGSVSSTSPYGLLTLPVSNLAPIDSFPIVILALKAEIKNNSLNKMGVSLTQKCPESLIDMVAGKHHWASCMLSLPSPWSKMAHCHVHAAHGNVKGRDCAPLLCKGSAWQFYTSRLLAYCWPTHSPRSMVGERLENSSFFFLGGYGPSSDLGFCCNRKEKEVGKEKPLALSATVMTSGSAAVMGHLGLLLGRTLESDV